MITLFLHKDFFTVVINVSSYVVRLFNQSVSAMHYRNPNRNNMKSYCIKAMLMTALAAGTAGCGSLPAPSQTVDIAIGAGEACGAFPTVTYRAAMAELSEQITIMAGDQPTPGYQIIVADARQQKQHIEIAYRIEGPPEGSFLPQVITRPCVTVNILAEDWGSLAVTNLDTQQVWRFNR